MRARSPWLLLLALGAACAQREPAAVAPTSSEPVRTARAKLVGLAGKVSVKRAEGDVWQPAFERMELFENDKIRTVVGAAASVSFASGVVVNIGEDALVSIAETEPRPGQERTDLTVLRGQVDAEVAGVANKTLSVTTPAATVRAGREIFFQ